MTKLLLALTLALALLACTPTNTPTEPAKLGQTANTSALIEVINQPGPIEFNKHTAANWQVPLSGLLNLDHSKAIEAGLKDRNEAIQLFVYSLKHPTKGTYIIDSGISQKISNTNDKSLSFIVKKAMKTDGLETLLSTNELLKTLGPIQGVLLTHIHIDHIIGLPDIPSEVPVYIGPGETTSMIFNHAFTRGTTNRLLANVPVLKEWQFNDSDLIDIFGDGSLWAIHTPGHSPGSTAYLARTTQGTHLIAGDASHTRWGWDHQVEPGTYSKDGPLSAVSLKKLIQLTTDNPTIIVHPGHQH